MSLEIWHYYNSAQKIAFDQLIEEFNLTIGLENNIIIEAFAQGNINQLEEKIILSADKKVGASKTPNIVTSYPEVAYALDQKDMLANLETYLSDKEIDEYLDSYIEEGRLGKEKQLKIFPTAKATEIMMVNKTDWDKFAKATGAKTDTLATWEGVNKIGELYYKWTDSLTEKKNDGKAFFGRDALANYILVGSKQLGKEIFLVENDQVKLQLDPDIMRKLWDNFYIPYISGYYTSYGKFSSDDAKTGEIIAMVGSTTGVTFFPHNVTRGDSDSYDIELLVLPLPNFENKGFYGVQQGAGMAVLKSDQAHEKASVLFLKWLTEDIRDLKFTISSGYLPVKKASYNIEKFEKQFTKKSTQGLSKEIQSSVSLAMEQIEKYTMVAAKGFENGGAARVVLERSLADRAKKDRQKVVELIEEGREHQEAVSLFSTNENFEDWFLEFQKDLIGAIK